MRLKLTHLVGAFLLFAYARSEACDKKCRDFYYNCNPVVETDKPDEVIDCNSVKYHGRCPEFCSMCFPCEMASMDDLKDVEDELNARIDDLEDKIDELQAELDDNSGGDSGEPSDR